jgi:hypothetical protein
MDQALAKEPGVGVGTGAFRTDGAEDGARRIAAWARALDW